MHIDRYECDECGKEVDDLAIILGVSHWNPRQMKPKATRHFCDVVCLEIWMADKSWLWYQGTRQIRSAGFLYE